MNKIRYKKDTTPVSRWQVWMTWVDFAGSIGGKRRPVLVTEIKGDLCKIAEISSQPPTCESDVPILDLNGAGLFTESVVRTNRIRWIPIKSLDELRGRLMSEDRQDVKVHLGVK